MNFRQYVKNRETPLARFAYAVYRGLTRFEMPAPKSVWKPIYMVHKGVVSFFPILYNVAIFCLCSRVVARTILRACTSTPACP